MIDTDKYEGHTEGPWEEGEYIPSDEMIERFRNRELQGAVMQQDSNLMLAMIGLDGDGEKDRLLMADAPLLLAEVKRLRDIIDYIRDIGRAERTYRPLLSIMETVLTTEEYLEWRNEE